MLAVSAEYIFDLNQTGIDFLNEVKKVYIDKKSVWFVLNYPECTIYVQGMGDGTFYLYRTPVGYNFDFEDAENKYEWGTHDPKGVVRDLLDTRLHIPLKVRADSLRKRY